MAADAGAAAMLVHRAEQPGIEAVVIEPRGVDVNDALREMGAVSMLPRLRFPLLPRDVALWLISGGPQKGAGLMQARGHDHAKVAAIYSSTAATAALALRVAVSSTKCGSVQGSKVWRLTDDQSGGTRPGTAKFYRRQG